MTKTVPTVRPVAVELINGQPTTTSLDVAAHFGKRHDLVLRAIRELDCSPEFRLRNFAESSREAKQPQGGVRKHPMMRLTRDGFVFLCMGFTGPEAAKWKEAYIAAFNALEAQQRQAPPPASVTAVTAELTAQFLSAANDLYNVLHVHSHTAHARFLGAFMARIESAQQRQTAPRFTRADVDQCRAAVRKALERMYVHKDISFKRFRVIEDYLDGVAVEAQGTDAVSARVEAEVRDRLRHGRFLCVMDEAGRLVLHEAADRYMASAKEFPGIVADPGFPKEALPALIAAAANRLARIN